MNRLVNTGYRFNPFGKMSDRLHGNGFHKLIRFKSFTSAMTNVYLLWFAKIYWNAKQITSRIRKHLLNFCPIIRWRMPIRLHVNLLVGGANPSYPAIYQGSSSVSRAVENYLINFGRQPFLNC